MHQRVDGQRSTRQACVVHANFLTNKATVQHTGHRVASVAIAPIAAGETVAAFGGSCISASELVALPVEQQGRCIQIDEDLYMAGSVFAEAADMIMTVIYNPLGTNEAQLEETLPAVFRPLVPSLAGALSGFPVPQFFGLSLQGVEVSKNGDFLALFANLAATP